MELNDLWQQHKRFVVTVASGVIVFVIGSMLVDSFFRTELTNQERAAKQDGDKLRNTPMFGAAELDRAQKQNEGLVQAIAQLSKSVEFQARPRFRLDPARGPASSQYFSIVSGTREELLRLAGRANLRLPEDLGLPALSPTREPEIQKHLEAFDLVERVVSLALANGVERIDKIEIKLDAKLASREGVGELERTRVSFTFSGSPQPLVELLIASQTPAQEETLAIRPLVIERADITPARGKSDEAALEVTFMVVRLHPRTTEEAPARGK